MATQTDQKSTLNKWLLFFLFSVLLLTLCMVWGFSGEHLPTHKASFQKISPVNEMIFYSLSWMMSSALFFLFPAGTSFRKGSAIILGLAVFCRLAFLPLNASEDTHRYLSAGKLLKNRIASHMCLPEIIEKKHLPENFQHLNDPGQADISSGFSLFSLCISLAAGAVYYSNVSIKIIMIAFDTGVILFLLLLLRKRELDFRWSVFYALNPLILYSFAGKGYLDVMTIFFLSGALLCHYQGRHSAAFLLLGLSFQIDYVSLIFLPFFIRRENRRVLWLFFIAVIVPYVPIFLIGNEFPVHAFSLFGNNSALKGVINGILKTLSFDEELSTIISVSVFVIFYVLMLYRFRSSAGSTLSKDPLRNIVLVWSAIILSMPGGIRFDDIACILPFAVLRQRYSWIILSLTMCFYFLLNAPPNSPVICHIMIWGPFLSIFSVEIYYYIKRKPFIFRPETPYSVSVVIPVKNEASRIGRCIDAIKSDPAVREIIIVDAGSTDLTVSVSETKGAVVCHNHLPAGKGGGRGGQIWTGIKKATSEIVAVCHADTLIPSPVFTKMIRVLSTHPDVSGGSVGGIFDKNGLKMKWIEIANMFRAVFLGISFGDQIQFFRRRPVIETQIFPDIPLMEDVEFSIRLHRLGRQVFLFGDVLVSSRRWEKKGFKNSVWVIKTVVLYLLARLYKTPDTLALYKDYYSVDNPPTTK